MNERQNKYKKIFPQKSISGITFLFGNLATGHCLGKTIPCLSPSDHADYNDTGLKSLSYPGTESIKVQTDRRLWIL